MLLVLDLEHTYYCRARRKTLEDRERESNEHRFAETRGRGQSDVQLSDVTLITCHSAEAIAYCSCGGSECVTDRSM